MVIPSNGVVTKWGLSYVATAMRQPVVLLTLRGSGASWTVTGSSKFEQVLGGPFEFSTRVPVTAGDRLGIGGKVPHCAAAGAQMSLMPYAGQPIGSTLTVSGSMPNVTPSVWAQIEPDIDADGFGDETQDLCPQSAAYHAACPVPELSIVRLNTARGFKARATTAIETTATVNGSFTMKATKGKKARLVTFKSKKFPIGPGRITSLSLKWPRSLTSALKAIDSRKKLLVKVSVTADGIVTDAIKTYKFRLKGRG